MRLKRLWIVLIAVGLFISMKCPAVCAADSYVVSTASAAVEKLSSTQYVVPVYISGNKGIMGFRLLLNYDAEKLKISSVSKGLVTDSGTIGSDISLENTGSANILWTGVDSVDKDGSLIYLTVSLLEEGVTAIEMDVQYSGEDTFDGNYKDVAFDCRRIDIDISGNTDGDAADDALKSLMENAEEKAYLDEAKAALLGAENMDGIDAAGLKKALIKTMQQYEIKTITDIPDDREEEFWDAVEKELLAGGSVKKSQLKKVDVSELCNRLTITEDDYYGIVFDESESVEGEAQTGFKMIVVIVAAVAVILIIAVAVLVKRRKRHER